MSPVTAAEASTLVALDGAALVVTVLGTVAFAVSGVLVAAESRMDWIGALVLAVVTAVGGGSIRDLLIGSGPVAWVDDPWPVMVALGAAGAAIVVLRFRPESDPRNTFWFTVSDALGLGAFTVTGVVVSLDRGTSVFVAVFMGVISGVGGGVARDVLARRTPLVLVGEIYAVAALCGAVLCATLHEAGVAQAVQVWTATAVVVAVRLVAVSLGLNLPTVRRR